MALQLLRVSVMLVLATSGIVSLAVLLQPHSPTPLQSSIPPYLTGWGGVRLDEAGANVTSPKLDYVLVIMMENKNYSDIIGNSCCSYVTSLANAYGLATNYHNSDNRGSLPNYLTITTGNGQSWAGCNSPPAKCPGFVPISVGITDRLDLQGLSWRAYMEGMPSPCYLTSNEYYSGANGVYYPRHDPFIYLASVSANQSECNKIVPAGTGDSTLLNDLSSTSTASNFMWLTPNGCNDMHDCSAATGDNYLSGLVPQILSSNIFQTQNAALFIVWDEGSTSSHVPLIIAGPTVKTGYNSGTWYEHYSLLNTIETNWSLMPMTASDTNSQSMTEFFKTTKSTSDMELHLQRFQTLGYNTVRVDFTSPCTTPSEMGPYSNLNLARAITLAQKYNMWIIVDMHGYHDIETLNQPCWLSNWKTIIQQASPSYAGVIWEPENEQNGDTVTLAQLSSGYQAWITQARALGDNHWIVVSNQCVGTCNLWPRIASLWPTVTDPLHEILVNYHSYMYYPYWKDPKSVLSGSYVNTNGWTNETAETVAHLWLNITMSGITSTGYRAINTEIGADPISGVPSDTMIPAQPNGCDAYTLVTLHFIQTLVKLYIANGISWTGFAAGSWSTSGTSGCGSVQGISYGALQPVQGWGTQLYPETRVSLPPVLSASFNVPRSIVTGQVTSFPARASGGVPPYSYSWSFGDKTNSTGSSPSHYYSNPGTYNVTLTATDSTGRSTTYDQIITVNGSPIQPPGGQPSGGTGVCLLCQLIPSTSSTVSTMMLLSVGVFSGLGLYYARFQAKNRSAEKGPRLMNGKTVRSIGKKSTGNNRISQSSRRRTRLPIQG